MIPKILCTVSMIFLVAGCASTSTISTRDKDALYQYSSELFNNGHNFLFFALPSMGESRDKAYMAQYKTLGIPTEAAKQITEYLRASQHQAVCLSFTGASSARTAHVIKEAFMLLPTSARTSNLKLLYIGEPSFAQELKDTVEAKGGAFFFKEYYPKT